MHLSYCYRAYRATTLTCIDSTVHLLLYQHASVAQLSCICRTICCRASVQLLPCYRASTLSCICCTATVHPLYRATVAQLSGICHTATVHPLYHASVAQLSCICAYCASTLQCICCTITVHSVHPLCRAFTAPVHPLLSCIHCYLAC